MSGGRFFSILFLVSVPAIGVGVLVPHRARAEEALVVKVTPGFLSPV
jgi:hypothetical protein